MGLSAAPGAGAAALGCALAAAACGAVATTRLAHNPPDCDSFCVEVVLHCRGASQVYDGLDSCLSACRLFAADAPADADAGNSLQCRMTYAVAAPLDPTAYCRNVAADGGDACR